MNDGSCSRGLPNRVFSGPGFWVVLFVCLGVPGTGEIVAASGDAFGPGPPAGHALSAPVAPEQTPSARPGGQARTIDLSYCLGVAGNRVKPDEDRCPGFILQTLPDALQACEEAGGELKAHTVPSVRATDVNGDGNPEFLFDMGSNFTCEGAWSVFSCGSLGCPSILYEQRDGKWSAIGAIDASTGQPIEVAASAGETGYRQLQVGCLGQGPCEELVCYEWTGTGYEQVSRRVRGFWVDLSGSVHGLRDLLRETPVLAAPSGNSEVLERYPAGTEVAIIGQARSAPYYYVSPCNACESGFVERSAVRRE